MFLDNNITYLHLCANGDATKVEEHLGLTKRTRAFLKICQLQQILASIQ